MTQNIVDDQVWYPGAPAELISYSRTLDDRTGFRVAVSGLPATALPEAVVRDTGDALVIEVRSASGSPYGVSLMLPLQDPVTLWTPGSETAHGTVPASWAPAQRISALDGVAIGSLVTTGDRAALTYSADSGGAPLDVRGGVVEETAELVVSFETQKPNTELTIRVDLAGNRFADSVTQAGSWLGREVNSSSPSNERPVFCTWYYAHQDVRQDELVDQARLAAEYGFGTVIIDDGWQTDEHYRGYGSAGDWRPAAQKLPDPRALTDELEAHGLRTMWWIGTPFVGERSAAHSDPDLCVLYDVPELNAAVLDVRSPAVRQHIRGRAVDLLTTSGGHGFKLDFLERFAAPTFSPPPHDADHVDVEAAALTLIRELVEDARTIEPDLMIELREPYFGAEIRGLASMVRVEDCPISPIENRVGIADLRLVAPQTAIHSDPVMWAEADSPERVAHYLLNALMGVPQVSADLIGLRPEHADVLAFWLRFWNENSGTILHGTFVPHRPDLSYPVMEARGETDIVIARYAPTLVTVPNGAWERISIANADAETHVPLAAPQGDYDITVTNARGGVVHRNTIDLADTHRLEIPSGGLATLVRRTSP